MHNKKQIEDLEALTLAPYAAKNRDSCGRAYPEPAHEYRSGFQRDRDRIIHTSAFRRLEYKTQVFVNHEGDYYRTRLTHTLEVAQIGRTMARALSVNEDLTEAICLSHDLGHTPFGHAGQDIMNSLTQYIGGFEHNLQSYRIVTKLESPYPTFTGLNLTYEVLEGIAKHATEYDTPTSRFVDVSFIKPGYPSLEAQIANFADEIAYNNHDIDDGLESGMLSFEALDQVILWKEAHDRVCHQYPQAAQRTKRRLTVKAIINLLVTDAIQNTTHNLDKLKINSISDIRNHGQNLLSFSPTVQTLNTELKKFLHTHLYRHYRLERMTEKAEQVLTRLFGTYLKNPKIMPPEYRASYPLNEPYERIVCDYISGMTDRFALDEYAKLFDPHTEV